VNRFSEKAKRWIPQYTVTRQDAKNRPAVIQRITLNSTKRFGVK